MTTEHELTILEFVEHQQLLNDRSLSKCQRAILKSIYGLALDEEELEIYKRCTGLEIYDPKEQIDVSIIAGRRGGKTSKIAAPVAVFEAFRDHGLPPGEEGYVLLLAPQRAQARIAFRAIRRYIMSSPVLSKHVIRVFKDEIKLDNGITICCGTASYVAVRGVTIVAVICDEMAFWRHDETSANPEQEILDALRPGMATVRNPKLIKISTPFRKEGILWNEYQMRAQLEFPVWQVSTQEMNPTISSRVLNKAQRLDEQKYRREYLAEFCENIASWIEYDTLQACVVPNRRELPPVAEFEYMAVIDPGFVHSDFALAILQLSPDGIIALCQLRSWRGSKKQPIAFGWVCRQIKQQLDEYGINRVITDQYYAQAVIQELSKLGVVAEQRAFSGSTRATIFSNLRHLLVEQKIELLDSPELLSQLRSLEEERTERGQINIRARGQNRDDLAVVVALGANELSRQTFVPLVPELGIVETFRQDPFNCDISAVCGNFPRCMDRFCCQGFKHE
jgi:hypothetical protein